MYEFISDDARYREKSANVHFMVATFDDLDLDVGLDEGGGPE